jgi:hypothetical protein
MFSFLLCLAASRFLGEGSQHKSGAGSSLSKVSCSMQVERSESEDHLVICSRFLCLGSYFGAQLVGVSRLVGVDWNP